jgi:hypothetical protein
MPVRQIQQPTGGGHWHQVQFKVKGATLVPEALSAVVFAVLRAAEAAGVADASIAAATNIDGRTVFIGLPNAASLRKSGIVTLLQKRPTVSSAVTPALLAPCDFAVSCSAHEESYFGAAAHVHVAIDGAKLAVTVTAPAPLPNLSVFLETLRTRLTEPNDFD